MTIPNNPDQGFESSNWQDLHTIPYAFDGTFQLNLTGGQVFYAEKIVRLIPKRRLVAFGIWQGKPVVAKLFFDPKRAKRHMEKDVAGIKLLQKNKVPTPALCYEGLSSDKRIYVLIFERIVDAISLEELWLTNRSKALLPILQNVIIELATQHVLGILQNDLHLNNFLLTEKTIYTLDGAQIEFVEFLLPKKPSIENLALFLSQFGVGMEELQENLFQYYAKARGWLLKPEDKIELFLAIKKHNEERWQHFEKKIFRDSTHFSCQKDWRTFTMYNREYTQPEFMQFLAQPDAVFQDQSAVFMKKGRSSTVIKIKLDGKELVIKRYNIKNILHGLRRCLRPTRAYSCWRLAQKLSLFGIRTAKPIAFIEQRYLGLRGKSYYVTEYVAGDHIGEYFNRQQESVYHDMIQRMTMLLKNIAKLKITHGDLKKTNILIDQKAQPVLIDLDGAKEHLSLSSLRAAWKKELKRFFENFNELPKVIEKFKSSLQ